MTTIEDLQKIYSAHDADGSGALDKEEARKAVLALGERASHVADFDAEFEKVASNGVLDFEAFKHFAKGHHSH